MDHTARKESICKSSEDNRPFHITTINENNEAQCDCKSFKGLKMCSHVLASAHLSGRLYEVVRYHRQKHQKRKGIDLFAMSVYTSRSSMKDIERKRVRSHSSPKSPLKKMRTSHCDLEQPGMVGLALLCENKQVKTCYGCKKATEEDNPERMSVAEKLHRSRFDQRQFPSRKCGLIFTPNVTKPKDQTLFFTSVNITI